jgi:hypothetical protein
MVAQCRDRNRWQGHNTSRIAALGLHKLESGLFRVELLVDPLECLANVEPARIEIKVGPRDAETFTQTQAKGQNRSQERIQSIGISGFQECSGLLDIEIPDVRFRSNRRVNEGGDVSRDITIFHRGV